MLMLMVTLRRALRRNTFARTARGSRARHSLSRVPHAYGARIGRPRAPGSGYMSLPLALGL